MSIGHGIKQEIIKQIFVNKKNSVILQVAKLTEEGFTYPFKSLSVSPN